MLFQRHIAGQLPAPRRKKKLEPIRQSEPISSEKTFLKDPLYKMGRSFLHTYMDLMIDVDIIWEAPLPEGPRILAVNHPTSIDPFYILTLFKEPVSVLFTPATFDVPIFGDYLLATGHISAVRGSGGGTVKVINQQIESGRSVAIFPEGALSPLGGGFHKPHSGIARVALHTGAPVIPIGIGLQQERIKTVETRKDGEKVTGRFYPSGPYAMTIGHPHYFEGEVRDRKTVQDVANEIMGQIRILAYKSEIRIRSTQSADASALNGRTFPTIPIRSLW